MKFLRKRTVFFIIAAGIVSSVLLWQATRLMTSADPLSEADASQLVQDMYGGEIKMIERTDDYFLISIKSKNGFFDIKLDQDTGEIIAIDKESMEKAEKQQLSETDVEELIKTDFTGEINQIDKKAESGRYFYYVTVKEGTAKTKIKLDAQTGSIIESVKKEIPDPIEDISGISEQEAMKIALEQVKGGKVDDVDLEESDGLYFYLIEVEQNDGEATVQINAITGEVMSIVWDD